MITRITVYLAFFAAITVAAQRADGGERRFTYIYEAKTLQQGEWEFEQWVTWKTAKDNTRDFDRFDFRTEIEYGVTDKFQLGLYLSDWRYEETSSQNKRRGDWRDVAVEGIWNLWDPTTEPLGLALYGEIKFGDELLELEGKVILQKNIGKLMVAYNATIEAEWEDSNFDEDKGKFEQTFGLSYQFSPRFLAGVELLHEVFIPDWQGARGKGVLYVGPNFSYRTQNWWATLTPLFQVSNVDDEPDFQMRLIFGLPLGESPLVQSSELERSVSRRDS